MIDMIGKGLALAHVGLSIMLMAFAAALYANAVDYGWKKPQRAYIETEGRSDNQAIPSQFDKREAAMRKLARLKWESVLRLGNAQASFIEVEPFLGDNHLKGEAELTKLESGPGTFEIRDIKYDDQGFLVLEPGTSRQLGFPVLDPLVPGVNRSYATYLEELDILEGRIHGVQEKTNKSLEKEEKLTVRMIGEVDKEGKPVKVNGAVKQPGWYYLLEAEAKTQVELKKELEYLQPLWVKELVDAQGLVTRREALLRRLEELGAKGYMTQSEFLKKLE